jgi:formylglycine-generating enzyme required for sulfatase activity
VDDTLYVSVSSDFNIDKYEVTNALYVDYLNQANSEGKVEYNLQQRIVVHVESQEHLITLDGAASRIRHVSEQLGFLVAEEYEQHPVTGVTWYGAHAYAWEIAARANHIDTNLEARYIYPWVPPDTIDGALANYRNSGDPFEEEGNQRATTPVGAYNGGYIGSFPTNDAVGPFETYDQAGNVTEWVNDWYDEAVYQELLDHYLSTGSPKTDPRGPRDGTHKVYRGGSFYSTTDEVRVTQRRATPPHEVSARLGFRTAHVSLN